MPTADNVLVGKPNIAAGSGGIYYQRNAAEADIPTDALTALAASWLDAGYVSSDGLTKTTDSSTEKVVAWGTDVVKILETEHSVSFVFTLIEPKSANALNLIFGESNVTVDPTTGAITVEERSGLTPRASFVFDMLDGDTAIRVVVPDGQPSVSGDVTYVDGDVIGYQVTVEAFPVDGGVKAYQYMADATVTAPPAG